MHDEDSAINEIRGMTENARMHLSHIMRHHACDVFLRLNERRKLLDEQSMGLYNFEKEIERLGL